MYVVVVAWQDEIAVTNTWVMMFGEWIRLKVNGEMPTRDGFCSTVCNGKIYVHGGQVVNGGHIVFLDDFYSLILASAECELTFEQLSMTKGLQPEARSGHKMTSLR